MLFLNNVNVESFVQCRKNDSLLTNASEMERDNVLRVCQSIQWSLNESIWNVVYRVSSVADIVRHL